MLFSPVHLPSGISRVTVHELSGFSLQTCGVEIKQNKAPEIYQVITSVPDTNFVLHHMITDKIRCDTRIHDYSINFYLLGPETVKPPIPPCSSLLVFPREAIS